MSAIREYVMDHELFCHHDHHANFEAFDANRENYTYRSLLGYAEADLFTAKGERPRDQESVTEEEVAELWHKIRVTGYGRAVSLGCRELLGMDYEPANFGAITEALQSLIEDKSAQEIYAFLVHEKAQNAWTIQDGRFRVENDKAFREGLFPSTYRFAFRMDPLFEMVDEAPIVALERFTERSIHTLDQLVAALNATIDRFDATGDLAAFKVGMAYGRDLHVGDPTRYEAERAFARIRSRKVFWDGVQQNTGAVDAQSGRPLGDYLLHCLLQRASDEDMPVQIHTGYLAGNWGSLNGTKASHLIPIFDRYRSVRFDIFHASWPWASELGAIAKNYPNVWPDMCWAWTMNPTESARALSEWLDGVPFNKIFAYGADTGLPWCNVGYSLQAKRGVARVLEEKIAADLISESTAEEIADCIMLENGKTFFDLD
ncbi:MAG: amidohydrolase family protein [Chloroflexota bacterium]|nr:amidohydrolase family protein [Chloroflexota bacterium]